MGDTESGQVTIDRSPWHQQTQITVEPPTLARRRAINLGEVRAFVVAADRAGLPDAAARHRRLHGPVRGRPALPVPAGNRHATGDGDRLRRRMGRGPGGLVMRRFRRYAGTHVEGPGWWHELAGDGDRTVCGLPDLLARPIEWPVGLITIEGIDWPKGDRCPACADGRRW